MNSIPQKDSKIVPNFTVQWRLDEATDLLQVRKDGGAWGSVCNRGFDDNTAHAVCRWMSEIYGTQLLNGYSWSRADTVLK